MVETLQNLEHVYAKWNAKNPYHQGVDKDSTSTARDKRENLSLDVNSYQNVTSSGQQAWRTKYANVGPPPERKTRYRNKRGGNKATSFAPLPSTGSSIAQFKTMPTVLPTVAKPRPFIGRCCTCMSNSRNDLYEESMKSAGLISIFRMNAKCEKWPYIFFGQYKYYYPDVSLKVLASPRIVEAIQKSVLQNLGNRAETAAVKVIQKVEKAMTRRAKDCLCKMKAEVSSTLLRFTAWFLHKFLSRFINAVVVHKGQMQMVQKACQKDLPVIFLPTHRSHLDYILVTLILEDFNLKAPHVAAGENLLIPLFGFLMRGLGGYFIRRKMDREGKKDYVYRAVLQNYMEELLKEKQSFEFFVEGGRTRSGKALYPKGGLLSVIVDSLNEGVIPDVYLAPVSISYDKVVDGNFNCEQMGERKISETFWRAVTAIWKVFRSHYGTIRVNFSQPFSLKEYLQASENFVSVYHDSDSYSPETMSPSPTSEQLNPRGSDSDMSLYGTEMVVDMQRLTIQQLADHVVYNCVCIQSVMSPQMVAFLFLTRYRQGVSLSQLEESFDWLREEISQRGRDIGFSGTTKDSVQHACRLIGPELVTKKVEGDETVLIPKTSLPSVFELSYYANSIHSIFALESVLANALYSVVSIDSWTRQDSGSMVYVSRDALLTKASELCRLLKHEFIFVPPCTSLESALMDVLDQFLTSEILQTEQDSNVDGNERAWANRLSADFQDEDSEDEEWNNPDILYLVNQGCEYSMEKFWFLQSVLASVLETYYVATCNLTVLQQEDLQEDVFYKTIHENLKNRVVDGVACYSESAALDSVRNTLASFKSLSIVDCYQIGRVKMVGLSYKYKVQSKLEEFIETLERYRPHQIQ